MGHIFLEHLSNLPACGVLQIANLRDEVRNELQGTIEGRGSLSRGAKKSCFVFVFAVVNSSLLKGCFWYINIFGIQRSVFVAFFAGIHGFHALRNWGTVGVNLAFSHQ